MGREATARRLDTSRPDLRAIPGHGGRPPHGGRAPAVTNAHLGVMVLLAAETMLFMGLVGAYVLYRTAAPVWPPSGLPRLPLLVTWLNTAVLLSSGYTMHRARRAGRAGETAALVRYLMGTAALGVGFLIVQGSEWVRLVRHGLTLASGTYGSSFYTVIGLHGVHVLAAVVWLLGVCGLAVAGGQPRVRSVVVDVCAVYWYFVVGLWPALFALLYLW
jgi:cytochrome c oxidase subunit 3